MILEFIFPLIIYSLCLWFISKASFFNSSDLTKYELWFFFSIKVFSGIALFTIYTYYYTDRSTADIYKYFDDAGVLFQLSKNDFRSFLKLFFDFGDSSLLIGEARAEMLYWDKAYNYGSLNDNRTIIRANTLIYFISQGNFQIHNVFFNLLSFTGCIGLYRFFRAKFQLPKWIVLLSIFILPSFLFWSSGVLKEGILIFGLGMFLYHIFNNESKAKWIFASLALLLLIWIKFYVLMAILPALIFIGINKYSKLKPLWNWSIGLVSLFLIMILLPKVGGVDFISHLIQKQRDFFELVRNLQPNSLYYLPEVSSLTDVVFNSPRAFFTTIFRPFIWEVNGALDALASIENISFIVLAVIAIVFRKKDLAIKKWPLFNWTFVISLSLIIGLVIPVFGALVRYKTPLLPFLIIALFATIDLEKMYKTIPFLRKLKNL